MGEVVAIGQLTLENFRTAYPFQTQPTIQIPDITMLAALGNSVDQQNFVADQAAGCGYAQPVWVPHDQRLSAGTVKDNDAYISTDQPDWIWDNAGTSWHATVKAQCFKAKAWGYQTLDFTWPSTSSPAPATVTLQKVMATEATRQQGFIAWVSRVVYNSVPSGVEAIWEVQWLIDTTLYSVRVSNVKGVKLRYSTDAGVTWHDILSNFKHTLTDQQVLGNAPASEGQNRIPIKVLLLNDVLQVSVGGGAVPVALPLTLTTPLITKVIATATCFTQFNCEIHPIYFSAQGTMRSNFLTLGFPPNAGTPPSYYVAGSTTVTKLASGGSWAVTFPASRTIKVTRTGLVTDQDQQYDLEINGPTDGTYRGINYTFKTAVVTRVSVHVDGLWAVASSGPVNVVPKEVREHISLDLQNYTIRQRVTFTLDNIYGQWAGQAGNIACQLKLGLASPAVGMFTRFTGMCGTYRFNRPATNQATITFEAQDLMSVLAEQEIWAPPLMDGWNHYYAMAFLAQYAGFTLSQMAFNYLVPSDPYSSTSYDTAPYFLPFGDGMRPWTPRSRESTVLQLMNYVRKPTGFMLYVDAQGYLRYEKWVPPSVAAIKKVFTEGPSGSGGSNLSEYFDFNLSSSVEQVRNQIVLVGIDPYDPRWSVRVLKKEDTASIYAAAGFEPKNYIGYKKPFVWTDSRFANAAFQVEAANRLYEMLRIPGLDARITSWLQPHLFPMDVVYCEESRSGSTGVPFYLTEIENYWGYQGQKEIMRSTLNGKFIVS